MGRIQEKYDQGTDPWLKQRLGVLTASKSGQIAYGVSAQRDLMREEIRDFIGAPSELQEKLKDNPDVQRGTDFEDTARFAYLDETGYTMETNSLYFHLHDEYDWIGASPDGIVIDEDGNRIGIEIKCPRRFTLVDGKNVNLQTLKKAYYGQMQHFMQVCNLGACEFIEYVEGEIKYQRVFRDEEFWSEHFVKLQAFRDEYLSIINDETEREKYRVGKDVKTEDDRIDRLIHLKQQIDEFKAESDSLKKELYEEYLLDKPYHGIANSVGYRLYKKVSGGSINNNAIVKKYQTDIYQLIQSDGASVEDFRTKGSESLVFSPPSKK